MNIEGYDLFLDLDFKNLKFLGTLKIEIESENDVALNSIGLNILKVSSGGKSRHYEQRGEDLVIKTGSFKGTLKLSILEQSPTH